MPKFSYRAKKGPQEVVEGILEAENQDQAVTRLTEQGFVPVRVIAAAEKERVFTSAPLVGGRVRQEEVTFFTRHLANLFKSNIPILRSLELIRSQAPRAGLRSVIGQIAKSVREGQSLSEAFSRFPQLFSPLYLNLVRAGEVSGQMDVMLDRLVEHREKQEILREKVKLATVYPLFLLGVGAATIVVLLTVVIPRLSLMFQDFGQALPWPTQAVMAASGLMTRTWWIWASGGLVAGVLFTRQAGPGRALLDRLELWLPFWRELTRKVEVARFCRTLGILLESGIPILQAVRSAIPTVENRVIRGRLVLIEGMLTAGTPLSRSLQGVPGFSALVVGIITIGEEGGDLAQHLVRIADSLEHEVERALKVVTTLLEPVLILALGVVVGIIVAAMLLPIFEIGSGLTLEEGR
ncbi:MAG: type II secretion system F family protein [Candidatus Omnitrophica bacterium]|nr:type II secretion system F family protein [Candidatus Omnitrophota bacterium]